MLVFKVSLLVLCVSFIISTTAFTRCKIGDEDLETGRSIQHQDQPIFTRAGRRRKMESTTIIIPEHRHQRVINTLLVLPRSRPMNWVNQAKLSSTPPPQQSPKLHQPGKQNLASISHPPRLSKQRRPRNILLCLKQQQPGGTQVNQLQSLAGVSIRQQKQPPAAIICTQVSTPSKRSFTKNTAQTFTVVRWHTTPNILPCNDLHLHRIPVLQGLLLDNHCSAVFTMTH